MHAGHTWGKGDPIMTGFGGRAFEFLGQPGKIYSLLSERYHQVGLPGNTLQIHHKALAQSLTTRHHSARAEACCSDSSLASHVCTAAPRLSVLT